MNKYSKECLKIAIRFGTVFTICFIIAEGIVAPITNWGKYSQGALLFWETPIYLIFAWIFIGSGIGLLNCVLQDELNLPLITSMGILSIVLFFFALLGEAIGNYYSMWTFYPNRFSIIGVPLWVPLSYSLAFLFSPLLYNRKLGGIVQAILVSIFWQLSRIIL